MKRNHFHFDKNILRLYNESGKVEFQQNFFSSYKAAYQHLALA